MAIRLVDGPNPDALSMKEKTTIDISVSLFDVSASGHPNMVRTNYAGTELTVTVPNPTYTVSSSYYSPIYKEELNYDVWLNRINKNFQELD